MRPLNVASSALTCPRTGAFDRCRNSDISEQTSNDTGIPVSQLIDLPEALRCGPAPARMMNVSGTRTATATGTRDRPATTHPGQRKGLNPRARHALRPHSLTWQSATGASGPLVPDMLATWPSCQTCSRSNQAPASREPRSQRPARPAGKGLDLVRPSGPFLPDLTPLCGRADGPRGLSAARAIAQPLRLDPATQRTGRSDPPRASGRGPPG